MATLPLSTPDPATPASLSRRQQLFAIFALVFVLAVVAYGAYWFWNAQNPSDSYVLVLASDSLPLAHAQTFHVHDGSLAPLTVEGQGTAVVLDAVMTDDAVYYLIGDSGFNQSNLYRQDSENPSAGLVQLTNSDSIKFSLSYDTLSDTAAYTSIGTDGEPHIMVWNRGINEEKDIGLGERPTLLPGGFFVMYRLGESLVSVRIETGERYEILSIEPSTPFTVDRENLKIALYESAIGTLQEYSIAGMTGASYLSSTAVPSMPQELVYLDGTLGRMQDGEAGAELVFGETVIILSTATAETLSGNRNLSTYE